MYGFIKVGHPTTGVISSIKSDMVDGFFEISRKIYNGNYR